MDSRCCMLVLVLVGAVVLARAGPMVSETTQDPCDACDSDSGEFCCNGECVDSLEDCIGVDEGTLLGIGIAATVAVFAVPIICCCCCCGCAAYWITRRRKSRNGFQGQVQQPGMVMMPPQGQAYQPQMMPGQGQAYQPQMMAGQEQVQQQGGFAMPAQDTTE